MPLIGSISGSMSGSLTTLGNGLSYIRAGSNITVTSGSTVGGEHQVVIAAASGGSTDPAGSNTQVQFNDGGSFGGDSGMTFNKSTNTLSIEQISLGGAISPSESDQAAIVMRGSENPVYGGSDAVLFVSGTQTSFGQMDNGSPRSAVFGGDVVVSGTIRGGYVAPFQTSMLSLRSGITNIGFGVVPMTSAQGGPGGDTIFFVSGAIGDRQNMMKGGMAAFGGDVAVSGSVFVGQGLAKPTGTALTIEGNSNNSFVAVIDNDENTRGHVLKLLTDGNGSGTTLMEMEDGDGDTLFKARADGRFAFGPSGVSSMGAGTFVVGIDGGHSADIAISKRMQHLGDSDTFMDFPAVDKINFQAGGVEMLTMAESSNVGQVLILSGGAGSSADPSDFSDSALFVSGAVGSRGTSTAGTAVFGGDMCLSGTLHILSGSDVSETSPVVSMVARGGRPVLGSQIAIINAAAAQNTIPAHAVVHSNGVLRMGAGEVTDTLPTASSIIALIPDPKFGLQIEFAFMNASGNTVTIGNQSGIVDFNQSAASFAITAGKGRMFRFAINSNLSSLTLFPVSDLFNLTS